MSQTVDGFIIIRESDIQRLLNHGKRNVSVDTPMALVHPLELLFLFQGLFLLDISDDPLDQIHNGDNTGKACIFIQYDGKGNVVFLHIAEGNVSLGSLRNEKGRANGVFQNRLTALILKSEIVLTVQNADDVIDASVANGIEREAVGANDPLPILVTLLHPKVDHVHAVDGNLSHSEVIKGENIFDQFPLFLLNDTLFRTDLRHHTNILFADLFIIGMGIDPQKAQNAVGGDR